MSETVYTQGTHPTARDVPVGTIDPVTGRVAAGGLYGWLSLEEYLGVYPTVLPRFGENGAGAAPEDLLLGRHFYMPGREAHRPAKFAAPKEKLYEMLREGYPSCRFDSERTLVDCISAPDGKVVLGEEKTVPQGTICPLTHFVASPEGWLPADEYRSRYPLVFPRWYENGNITRKIESEVRKTFFIHRGRTVTPGTIDPLTWHVAGSIRWEPIDAYMVSCQLGTEDESRLLWGENGAPERPRSWPQIPTAWLDRVTGVLEELVRPWAVPTRGKLSAGEKRSWVVSQLVKQEAEKAVEDPRAHPSIRETYRHLEAVRDGVTDLCGTSDASGSSPDSGAGGGSVPQSSKRAGKHLTPEIQAFMRGRRMDEGKLMQFLKRIDVPLEQFGDLLHPDLREHFLALERSNLTWVQYHKWHRKQLRLCAASQSQSTEARSGKGSGEVFSSAGRSVEGGASSNRRIVTKALVVAGEAAGVRVATEDMVSCAVIAAPACGSEDVPQGEARAVCPSGNELSAREMTLVTDLGVPYFALGEIPPVVEGYMRGHRLDYVTLVETLARWGVSIQEFPRLLSEAYQPVLYALEVGNITIQEYYRNGGTLFKFDFSIDKENNIWITGPQEIIE